MKRTRIKPQNAARRAKTHARAFGDKADWIRSFPCAGCGRHGVQAAHAKPMQYGAAHADSSELVPLCAWCHRDSSEYRTSQRARWEARRGLATDPPGEGLVELAAKFERRWMAGEDSYGAPY